MTKHLKPQELSAHQDGMLSGMARARAEAHLATCAECRAALERSVGLEHSLAEQLVQDPGENYFNDFASRIEARIHPAGAPQMKAKAPPGDGFWTWLNTPVGMSWAGAVAVLIVGAGVALITVRSIGPVSYPPQHVAARTDQLAAAPPAGTQGVPTAAPAESAAAEPQATPTANQPAAEPANEADGASGQMAQQQTSDQRGESSPARVMEMKPGPNGESMPVARRSGLAPAPAPTQTPADLQSGVPVKVRKNVTVQPLSGSASKDQETAAAAKSATVSKLDASSRTATAPSGARSGNMQTATAQRCGGVNDAGGHPVVGAQLMLVETGSNAQSRADGSFCLDVSAAAHTLVVMAVGFEAQRITLDPADQGPLSLTLRAVSVVGGAANGGSTGLESPVTSSRWVQKPSSAPGSTAPSGSATGAGGASSASSLNGAKPMPTPVGSTEALASLSDSVRSLALKALQFENDAARSQSAEQYRLAGEEWQKVLKRTQDGPAENETRFRIAAAYYRAWQLDPSHSRSVIALEAISSFVLRAPAGEERDQATMWLGHLRWGDTKAGDH